MKISIEDVKEELISILTEIEITGGSMVTSIYKDELKTAIDIMSKYQKIERIIYDDWDKGYQHSETLNRIKEVLKNDDK